MPRRRVKEIILFSEEITRICGNYVRGAQCVRRTKKQHSCAPRTSLATRPREDSVALNAKLQHYSADSAMGTVTPANLLLYTSAAQAVTGIACWDSERVRPQQGTNFWGLPQACGATRNRPLPVGQTKYASYELQYRKSAVQTWQHLKFKSSLQRYCSRFPTYR
jgi:hypothetical protein